MAGCVDRDNPRERVSVHRRYCAVVGGVDVSAFGEDELKAELAEVRSVQRVLDGLVARIGQRASALAAAGSSAPAAEVLRGKGGVAGPQAKREALRAETAEGLPAVGAALSDGVIGGAQVDVFARHTADLTPEQVSGLDVDALIGVAGRVPVETFNRKMRAEVHRVQGDHGLADTIAKQLSLIHI